MYVLDAVCVISDAGRLVLTTLLRCTVMKEWALLAIRNLLEDNEVNQHEVAKLTPERVVSQPTELTQKGMQLEINQSGRISIVRQPAVQQDSDAAEK
jgi:hypothetical protein